MHFLHSLQCLAMIEWQIRIVIYTGWKPAAFPAQLLSVLYIFHTYDTAHN